MKNLVFILLVYSVAFAQNKTDRIISNTAYNKSINFTALPNTSSNSNNAYAKNPNSLKINQTESYSIEKRSIEFKNKMNDLSYANDNRSPLTNNSTSKFSNARSYAIYNPEKSEIIYSKQIYAGEKLINGEIQRFNNKNELVENAFYEDGICKILWQKTDNTEIHWQTSPVIENSKVIVYSDTDIFSAEYKRNRTNSNIVTANITASNQLGTITFQSIQKNFQPNFRTITNIEFTSFSNTNLKCWCKNENDEVYLQFPYASFYPSGHIQLRGNVYVNICKKNKVKPFGKWYKYDPFGNIIGTENYLSLKEGVLTVAPPECEEY